MASEPSAAAAATSAPAPGVGEIEYLSFACGGEEYGVEIGGVQEIKGWDHVTRVPHAPTYVLGVMNLRGMIVPVVDLRLRLGLEPRNFDSDTVVIVLRVRSARGEKTVGIVVDAVSDVYSVPPGSIQPAPALGSLGDGVCVKGIATVADKMIVLLDIDALVSACVAAEATQN